MVSSLLWWLAVAAPSVTLICVSVVSWLNRRAFRGRRQSEEMLRQSEELHRTILSTSLDAVIILDARGRIVEFSGSAEAIFRMPAEDVLGKDMAELFLPPEHRQAHHACLERYARSGEAATFGKRVTLEAQRGDGERFPVEVAINPMRHAGQTYFVGCVRDLTEARRLEEQLRHAQKMETLGTLVGGIAHDFNNQLTAIMGNLSLALAATPPGAPGRIEIADAEQSAQHCAEMTRGLLTFSRRRVEQARLLDLNQIVGEAVRLIQRLLPAAIRIEVHAEPQLWRVNADSTQLHQVLMNLAINARDAMPNGGSLRITTATRVLTPADCAGQVEARPGSFAVLTVSDTGTGMPAEVKARIFEPFFTTKGPGNGTGLGLAIVFGIVKAHDGWIAVDSEPGRGTTFHLYLPGIQEEADHAPDALPAAVAGGTECVLVVDDEDMLRRLACFTLERWGFRVLTAADGEEALAVYCEHADEIDLVLLDYTMPKLNGLQVMEILQRWNPAIRVVFSSGYTIDSDSDRLLAAGAMGFIAKPYRPEDLVQTVRQALDDRALPTREVLSAESVPAQQL